MRLLVVVLAVASVVAWTSPSVGVRRLRRLGSVRSPAPSAEHPDSTKLTSEPATPDDQSPERPDRRRVWFAAVAFGLAIALIVGGWAGAVLGVIGGVIAGRLVGRMEPRVVRDRRARITNDLPLAAELLSACLRSGRPPERAVEVVGRAITGPLGVELVFVAETLRLGARADIAWARFLDQPTLERFGRTMIRAWHSGAPLADILERLADDARRVRRTEADRRARAVGVKAALPLGICFLPAFMMIGVVPLVAATIAQLLR